MGKTVRHNWVIVRDGDERLPFIEINAFNINFTCAPIFESRQKARDFLGVLSGRENEKLRIKRVHKLVVE